MTNRASGHVVASFRDCVGDASSEAEVEENLAKLFGRLKVELEEKECLLVIEEEKTKEAIEKRDVKLKSFQDLKSKLAKVKEQNETAKVREEKAKIMEMFLESMPNIAIDESSKTEEMKAALKLQKMKGIRKGSTRNYL